MESIDEVDTLIKKIIRPENYDLKTWHRNIQDFHGEIWQFLINNKEKYLK